MYLKILILLIIMIAGIYFIYKPGKRKPKNVVKDIDQILENKVSYFTNLSPEDKVRFSEGVQNFLQKVAIHGVETDVTDEDKVLVAASAVIPLFGFPGWKFSKLDEVLLYGNQFGADFDTKGPNRNIIGMVGNGAMNRAMILSKPALRFGFENQDTKTNVGIHEFVHLLDKADGLIDGIPDILLKNSPAIPWLKLVQSEIEKIIILKSDINPYGATNTSEFFSVASEYFFNQPHLFESKHPDLYEAMKTLYQQDFD